MTQSERSARLQSVGPGTPGNDEREPADAK